jgi:hypothetical protein
MHTYIHTQTNTIRPPPPQVNLEKDLLARQAVTLPATALQPRRDSLTAADPTDRVRAPPKRAALFLSLSVCACAFG